MTVKSTYQAVLDKLHKAADEKRQTTLTYGDVLTILGNISLLEETLGLYQHPSADLSGQARKLVDENDFVTLLLHMLDNEPDSYPANQIRILGTLAMLLELHNLLKQIKDISTDVTRIVGRMP